MLQISFYITVFANGITSGDPDGESVKEMLMLRICTFFHFQKLLQMNLPSFWK
jgi:hypothetical protein